MLRDRNDLVARRLLASLANGAAPNEVALLFSFDVQFEIAGDLGALPWIGHREGRVAVSDFIRNSRLLIERLSFDVQGILANDEKAVIVGELVTRVKATGKIIESSFAIILTVSEGGEITRFQMLEDSFAVSRAARP
jgi:ketosteroid isomerase-like protein